MSPLALVLAAVVGTTLGLFGGGGAVLAVPIFVYVLAVPMKSAAPMSLIVVGTASAIGAAARWRDGRLDPRRGLGIGLASMAGAFTAALVAGRIPDRVRLLLFAVAVIAAAASMLRSATAQEVHGHHLPFGIDFVAFALIGALTSVIGIGGGFLYVPALVSLLGVPISRATGLSMMVIAMNAIASLAGSVGTVQIEWQIVLPFVAVVVASTLVAGKFASRVPVPVLKRSFAVVLVAIGGLVLFENLYLK